MMGQVVAGRGRDVLVAVQGHPGADDTDPGLLGERSGRPGPQVGFEMVDRLGGLGDRGDLHLPEGHLAVGGGGARREEGDQLRVGSFGGIEVVGPPVGLGQLDHDLEGGFAPRVGFQVGAY